MEGLIFGGAYIRRGLSTEENLRFKINGASLIVGGKFAVYALFYFVFKGSFPSCKPLGAYIWRGLFSEFYGMRFKISSFSRGPTDKGKATNKCVCITKRLTRTLSFLKVWELISEVTFFLSIG